MWHRLEKLWRRFFPKKVKEPAGAKAVIPDIDHEHAESIAAGITHFVYMTHATKGMFSDRSFPHWIKSVKGEYYQQMLKIVEDNFAYFRPEKESLVEVQMKVNSMHNADPIYMIFVAGFKRDGLNTDVYPKLTVTMISEDEFSLYKAGLSGCPPWPESCHVIYKEVDLLYEFSKKMVEFTQGPYYGT